MTDQSTSTDNSNNGRTMAEGQAQQQASRAQENQGRSIPRAKADDKSSSNPTTGVPETPSIASDPDYAAEKLGEFERTEGYSDKDTGQPARSVDKPYDGVNAGKEAARNPAVAPGGDPNLLPGQQQGGSVDVSKAVHENMQGMRDDLTERFDRIDERLEALEAKASQPGSSSYSGAHPASTGGQDGGHPITDGSNQHSVGAGAFAALQREVSELRTTIHTFATKVRHGNLG